MGNRHLSAEPAISSDALLQRVVALCHERKAEDVVCLDVRGLVEYMDYMVIATGRSPRQNRAIGEHVITQLKREHRLLPLSKAGMDGGSWICVDHVDVVLHIFDQETRVHYDLELLWADAVRTEFETPASDGTETDAEEWETGEWADEASSAEDVPALPQPEEDASIESQMIRESQASDQDATPKDPS